MTKIGQFWPYSAVFIPEDENFLFVNFLYKVIFKLILKMESKIWLDSIKWSKNCHFWFFRQNDENPNFWLWIVKAQKRKGFISYQYYFFHIQSICHNMTYMVFVRFDLREVFMLAHLISRLEIIYFHSFNKPALKNIKLNLIKII